MLLIAIAGTAMVVAAIILLRTPAAGPTAHLLPPPSPIISVVPSASPTGPTAQVPPDGMRVKMPELGLDLPVVAGDGVNAPLYKAVLYPWLALPGSGKRSMIYAHARNGMFGPLFRAKVGQVVEVDR